MSGAATVNAHSGIRMCSFQQCVCLVERWTDSVWSLEFIKYLGSMSMWTIIVRLKPAEARDVTYAE